MTEVVANLSAARILVMLKANKKRRIGVACQRGPRPVTSSCRILSASYKSALSTIIPVKISLVKQEKEEDPCWRRPGCKVNEVEGVDARSRQRDSRRTAGKRTSYKGAGKIRRLNNSAVVLGSVTMGKKVTRSTKAKQNERQLQNTVVSHADLLLFYRELLRERKSE